METEVNTDARRLRGHARTWRPGRPLSDAEYRKQLKARFWAKVDKTPGQGPDGDCWEWKGSLSSNEPGRNYGQIGCRRDGVHLPIRTHVVSFYLHNGYWPADGMFVCHTCDNPPCVNPAHLWDGSPRQNWVDSERKGRSSKPRKPRPQLAQYPRVYLTPAQREIVKDARRARGLSQAAVAAALCVHKKTYCDLETGIERRTVYFEQLLALLGYLGIDREHFDPSACPVKYTPVPLKTPTLAR